ncbi:GNAT family N-acetyltransferase [Tolypothrix campylonemoides VB511288]|nr:GNAT family N-acetyltransferase [Tolypothrix campylonemoides VB511288]
MTEIFQTQRLIIRKWIPEADAAQAFEIYGDPEVVRFLSSNKPEESVENVRAKLQPVSERYAQLNNGSGLWAIVCVFATLRETKKSMYQKIAVKEHLQELKPVHDGGLRLSDNVVNLLKQQAGE